MNIELLLSLLGWCSLVNVLLLLWWLLFFIFARDWMYKLHGRWFNINQERFDTIHYTGMATYKLFIIFFNLIPYVILRILM